jgi:hypothetical protein
VVKGKFIKEPFWRYDTLYGNEPVQADMGQPTELVRQFCSLWAVKH